MNIYRVNKNLPRQEQVKKLNDMSLELEGNVIQGKFDKHELDQIFTDIGMSRKFLRKQGVGNTTSTYTSWTHLQAETGYSIWKFSPSNYAYNANNELFFDDKVLTNMAEANSETATSFDKVWFYNGDSGAGYTDHTTEAGTAGGTEFSLMNSTADYLYVGDASTFTGIKFEWETRGSNYTLKVEYYNASSGDGWTELTANTNNLDDDTNSFASDGKITWTAPSDWVTYAVNGSSQYWIRISTTDTPVTTAKAYYVIPGDSVVGLLALSSTQIQDEDWAWCSYGTAIYVTIRNDGDSSVEGSYYITSSSSSTNLENFFVHNNPFTASYESSAYAADSYLMANVSDSVVTKTEDYTITTNDRIILVDASAIDSTLNKIRISLPEASDFTGREFIIKCLIIEAGCSVVVNTSDSGELIDGLTTHTMTTSYDFVKVVSSGVNWYIIAKS